MVSRKHAIRVIKSLMNDTNVKVLNFLKEGPKTVSEVTEFTGKSQPMASRVLNELYNVDLVDMEKDGRSAVYSLGDLDSIDFVDINLFMGDEEEPPARKNTKSVKGSKKQHTPAE